MHRHSKSAASTGGGVPSAVPGDGPIEISIRAALTEIDKANIFLLDRPGCIHTSRGGMIYPQEPLRHTPKVKPPMLWMTAASI